MFVIPIAYSRDSFSKATTIHALKNTSDYSTLCDVFITSSHQPKRGTASLVLIMSLYDKGFCHDCCVKIEEALYGCYEKVGEDVSSP